MSTLEHLAAESGATALGILDDIREYRREEPYALRPTVGCGGWFDCECGSCISEGHDYHAWESFESNAQDAIHYAVVLLSERDFERAERADVRG